MTKKIMEEKNNKPQISLTDFAKLDMRVGTILEAKEVVGSEKLLNLTVDLGKEIGQRTILSGIKKHFDFQSLIETQVLVLANLEPKKMMGLESDGMILMAVERSEGVEGNEGPACRQAGFEEEKVTLLIPKSKVSEGTRVE